MTTTTPARPVSWSDVTLAEFAALDLLSHPDTLGQLNAMWDHVHEHLRFVRFADVVHVTIT